MGLYKLLQVKALNIRLILTFKLDKCVSNFAPKTKIPYSNLLS